MNESKNAERNAKIVEMRKAGKTLQAIGDEFGLSKSTVAMIIKKSARKLEKLKEDPDGKVLLSGRAKNTLYHFMGLGNDFTKEQVKEAIELHGGSKLLRTKNMGKKTLQEIKDWCGIEGKV